MQTKDVVFLKKFGNSNMKYHKALIRWDNKVYLLQGDILRNRLIYRGELMGFYIQEVCYILVKSTRPGSANRYLVDNGACYMNDIVSQCIPSPSYKLFDFEDNI